MSARSTSNLPNDSGFSVIAAAAEAAAVPKPMPAPVPANPTAKPAPMAINPDSASARGTNSTPVPPVKAITTLTAAAMPIVITNT